MKSAPNDTPVWELPRHGFPGPAERSGRMSAAELSAGHLSALRGDVVLPALVLRESALENNLRVLANFTRRRGVRFAPHAKTSLAPRLLARQLEAGAWGITTANVVQTRLALQAGARHILLANEVVGAPDIGWLAMWADRGTDIVVQVDSPQGVQILDEGFGRVGVRDRRPVLVELGHPGGRTGARGRDAMTAVADAVTKSDHLILRGLATYEGVVGHDRSPATLASVDRHIDYLREITIEFLAAGRFDHPDGVLVSAGGTRFVDRVVERLGADRWQSNDVDLVVRAGCYITYGEGAGTDDSPFADDGPEGRLIPAAVLWTEVLSLPEVGLAIVGVGKRNVGDRVGSIVPIAIAGLTHAAGRADQHIEVTGLDDHHAYLRYRDVRLEIGDRVGFGLRHPATLDRWRVIPLVDDDGVIVDAITTGFP